MALQEKPSFFHRKRKFTCYAHFAILKNSKIALNKYACTSYECRYNRQVLKRFLKKRTLEKLQRVVLLDPRHVILTFGNFTHCSILFSKQQTILI